MVTEVNIADAMKLQEEMNAAIGKLIETKFGEDKDAAKAAIGGGLQEYKLGIAHFVSLLFSDDDHDIEEAVYFAARGIGLYEMMLSVKEGFLPMPETAFKEVTKASKKA